MELQKFSSNVDIEELPNLYPYGCIPKEGKMMCYVVCIPKNLYPFHVLTSIINFELIFGLIFLMSNFCSIILFKEDIAIL